MSRACAIIGCSPMAFPWGFDEENEGCAALKLLLLNRITGLRCTGCTNFNVSIDCGVGLYAAEIVNNLCESDKEIELTCFIPYEEQATKSTPELRERYFNALATCTKTVYVSHNKTLACHFDAHFQAMKEAAAVIAVYDPDNLLCEREMAVVSVAEQLGKQIVRINPGGIHENKRYTHTT